MKNMDVELNMEEIKNEGIGRPIEILFVEDDPGDVDLTLEVLNQSKIKINFHVVNDGVKAIEYLRKEGEYTNAPRPNLILLDLNLPRKDGRDVLAEIKADGDLRRIPVVVLTTSRSEADILKSYDHNANCYITKPVDLNQFIKVVKYIEDFWLTIVKLPSR